MMKPPKLISVHQLTALAGWLLIETIVPYVCGSSPSDGAGKEEGGEGGGHRHEEGYTVFHVEFARVQLPFIISLWIFVASLAKIGFHMTPKLPKIFPESCLLIVVGIIIGFFLILTSKSVPTTLTPNIFFLFMLPPIILDAGYFMPNRLFFDHLGTILLMAVVGTVFNMLTIGASLYTCGQLGAFGEDPPNILEMFLFASLIVAVDPVAVLAVFEEIHVEEVLYIVVFGESLLNDAVTVVLYNMFDSYVIIGEENLTVVDMLKGFASFCVVAGGGTLIGVIWGFLTSLVTRFTNHARVLEPLFVFVMAYMSYLNAEIFHLSGILAITFCGITMKNYVERNISSKSQTTLKYALKMLSSSSETIIFMFLGVATIHDEHVWNWSFVVLTILFCTVFRIIGVTILVSIANHYRLHKLQIVDQFVMMYGGLRGAVAFALALLIDKERVPHAPMFVTTTIAVVYWTVFVQGITIKPLVRFLNIKTSYGKDPTMNERITGRFMDHVVAGMEGILGEIGNLRMRDMYKSIDTKYIRPCLLRENQYKDPKIIETYENLTNKDAIAFIRRNPSQFAGLKSMAELNSSMSTANLLGSVSTQEMYDAASNGEPPCAGGDIDENAPDRKRSSDSMKRRSSTPTDPNRDIREMEYTPSLQDVQDNRIHHMLSEHMFMPRARPRRMSYSRHAIRDEDMTMNHDINFRVHSHVRRMMSEQKAARKRRIARRAVLARLKEEADDEDDDTEHHSNVVIRRTHSSAARLNSNGDGEEGREDSQPFHVSPNSVMGHYNVRSHGRHHHHHRRGSRGEHGEQANNHHGTHSQVGHRMSDLGVLRTTAIPSPRKAGHVQNGSLTTRKSRVTFENENAARVCGASKKLKQDKIKELLEKSKTDSDNNSLHDEDDNAEGIIFSVPEKSVKALNQEVFQQDPHRLVTCTDVIENMRRRNSSDRLSSSNMSGGEELDVDKSGGGERNNKDSSTLEASSKEVQSSESGSSNQSLSKVESEAAHSNAGFLGDLGDRCEPLKYSEKDGDGATNETNSGVAQFTLPWRRNPQQIESEDCVPQVSRRRFPFQGPSSSSEGKTSAVIEGLSADVSGGSEERQSPRSPRFTHPHTMSILRESDEDVENINQERD